MNIIFNLLGFHDFDIVKYFYDKDHVNDSKSNELNKDENHINDQQLNAVDESHLDLITETNIDLCLGLSIEQNDKYKGLWSDDDI